MSSRILVIDDDEASRLLCRTALASDGHVIFTTGSPEQALAILEESPVSLLIVDVLLASADLHFGSPRSGARFNNGMQVVQAALAKRRDTPVLFISSHSRSTLLSKGVDGNRWPVLRKPFSPEVLRTEVSLRLQAAGEQTGLGRDPRKHARHATHCRLLYSGDHNGEGIAENLSLGGCLLNTNDVLEIDSHLVVQLLLNSETPVHIHIAVTRWGVTPKYGLDFILVDEQGERILLQYLNRLQLSFNDEKK